MNIFYSPDINDNFFNLSKEETIHCLKVLRHKKGDKVLVANGRGLIFECVLEDENLNGLLVKCVRVFKEINERKANLNIGISIVKNSSRFEWFVEKACEFGVSKITPLICKRTEKKNMKIERLNKIAVEAMKQSKNEFLTEIINPLNFDLFVKRNIDCSNKYIAFCSDIQKKMINEVDFSDVTTIVIGPEGDFTQNEIELSKEYGFIPVSFGDYRLRTETAGVFIASAFYYSNLKNNQ